jgi:quercetin dioxygenase-like cupin family protein
MESTSLTTLVDQQLQAAKDAASGRSSHTIFGGHDHHLRQTLIAMSAGQTLDEHESPGEATLQVLRGRVSLVSAIEDSAVLLTVSKTLGSSD